MKQQIFSLCLMFVVHSVAAQENTSHKAGKQRLDFAQTYFEIGAKAFPSFTGKRLDGQSVTSFEHAASIEPYLSWGGFHFWGHMEFYVTMPLGTLGLNLPRSSDFELHHFIVTGARFLPWVYKENKVLPYVGASWSGLEFAKKSLQDLEPPALTKEFSLVVGAGLLYGHKQIAARLGIDYFQDNAWRFPLSESVFETIHTPRFAAHIGVLYTFDSSRNEERGSIERWNKYPSLSRLGSTATRAGDFFVGLGPSSSFSLARSTYTQENFPFLKDRVSSAGYFDAAIGYQFNRVGVFSAVSFRNPEYTNKAFDVEQTIKKNSVVIEVNKFLVDYSGFAPYVGLNVAYDHIQYIEHAGLEQREVTATHIEPGVTIGWDIVPGKTEEYLILRTNLRWFPYASFEVDGKTFAFSQLEYNLIQAVFYPSRLFDKRR